MTWRKEILQFLLITSFLRNWRHKVTTNNVCLALQYLHLSDLITWSGIFSCNCQLCLSLIVMTNITLYPMKSRWYNSHLRFHWLRIREGNRIYWQQQCLRRRKLCRQHWFLKHTFLPSYLRVLANRSCSNAPWKLHLSWVSMPSHFQVYDKHDN